VVGVPRVLGALGALGALGRESPSSSCLLESVIWSTAASKTALLALEGCRKPLIFLTYCNAAARISGSVTTTSFDLRVLMLRHITARYRGHSPGSGVASGHGPRPPPSPDDRVLRPLKLHSPRRRSDGRTAERLGADDQGHRAPALVEGSVRGHARRRADLLEGVARTPRPGGGGGRPRARTNRARGQTGITRAGGSG